MEEAKRDEEESKQQQIWSWGAGTEGQLGTGKLEDEYLPQLLHFPFLSSAGSISTLACGGAHAIALTSVGKVFTWGRGTTGQLGHGEMLNSLHPKPISSLQAYVITHVSAGWSHSGFVSDIGLLFTCGDGSFGQLGLGDYRSHSTPVKVDYFDNNFVSQIACGMRHSLVLLKGNQVYGFGSGKRGQLGITRDKIKSVNLPQVTCGLEDVQIVSISANGDHSAAISADGHLYTWGRGFAGAADANFPQLSLSSLRCTKAVLGWNHGLLLTGDGELCMLGGNYHWGLCDLEKMSAVKHRSGNAFRHSTCIRIAVHDTNICDELLYHFQNWKKGPFWFPCVYDGQGASVSTVYMANSHVLVTASCHITTSLFHVPADSSRATLNEVIDLDGVKVVKIAAGAEHSALVTVDGAIKTWGWGEHGQLGLGNTNDQTIPQTVSLSPDIQNKEASLTVYCGSGFTFAIRSLSVNPDNIPRN